MPTMYDASDKLAFITGSAGGLGKEFAKRLLESGAKVCLSDINSEAGKLTLQELQERFGKKSVTFVACDVTQEDSLRKAFDEACEYFDADQLDILVNNAGVMGEKEGWKACMDINFKGVLQGTNLMLSDRMSTRNGGRGGVVVNVASILGLFNAKQPKGWAYNTSKSAVVSFSRCVALSAFAHDGVRVLCLCPSVTDTPILRDCSEAELDEMRRSVGGFMTPKQVGEAFVFLLSDGRAGSVMAVWKDCPAYYIPDLGFHLFVFFTTCAMILRFVPGFRIVRPWHAAILLICIPLSWGLISWLTLAAVMS